VLMSIASTLLGWRVEVWINPAPGAHPSFHSPMMS
jgi:hypothetical protein